jgi:hypothetical protein
MKPIFRGILLAGIACIAPASAGAADMPSQCRAFLTALQSCSDHLTASKNPAAPTFRAALQQTRETLPAAAAAGAPGLGAQCTQSLKEQHNTAHELGC